MQSMFMFLAQTVPEGRVFALDQQTVIQIAIQVLNGIILAVVLGKILYKPVKNFLAERSSNISNKIQDSDATMTKANELIAEYESKIENIDIEYEKVLEEGRTKAADEEEIILQEAREEAIRIKEDSLESMSREREHMELEARPYIIELATTLAERYVKVSLDKEEQDRLFDEVLAELEESQWRR